MWPWPSRPPQWVAGSWPTREAGAGAAAADAGEKTSTSFVVADAIVPSVELFAAGGVTIGQSLPNPTKYDLPLVFRVMEDHGPWLDVQVPSRPNGLRAFIRASDVTLPDGAPLDQGGARHPQGDGPPRLHGDPRDNRRGRQGHHPHADRVVLRRCERAPHRRHRPLRVRSNSRSRGSRTCTRPGRRRGPVALHGTNATGLLGQAASNGCVRLDNAALLRIQDLAPTGTPVLIVP